MKIYAIKDVKVGFMSPTQFPNDAAAKRAFENMARSQQPNMLTENPEDYEMWRIAEYNVDNGAVSPSLEFICSVGVLDDRN